MARRRSVFFRLLFPSVLLSVYLVSLLALTPRPAHAATYTVDSLADAMGNCAVVGSCTLRQAITDANASAGVADTITIGLAGTITLTSNLPTITDTAGLTINGAPTTIQGGAGIRSFTVQGGVLTLNNLTITGGTCYAACPVVPNIGGGVLNNGGTVNITNSIFSGNAATNGGGVFTDNTVNITNSTFSGNSAANGGGVFTDNTVNITNSTFSGNSAGTEGGGINNDGGTVSVTNSTFSGNSAASAGGGVYTNSTVSITNSTLSGNSAALEGGGVFNLFGMLSTTNSTFSGNSAADGGGIYNWFGTVTVRNTIVTASTNGDCVGGWAAGSANNLTDTATCAGRLGAVTGLSGTLGNNGGPTQTFALLAGSNAIDRTAAPCAVGTDQRGTGRPAGAGCDIGAFEFVVAPLPTAVPPAVPASSSDNGPRWPAPPPCPDAMTRVDSAIRANVPAGIARDAKGVLATVYICPLTKTYEIGVLDREILRAYEVFALTPNGASSVTRFTGPIRVCLQGTGAFLFRDANNAPRVVSELSVTIEDGFTCASVPHAGTIVLVTGAPRQTAPQTVSEKPLTDCQITTRNITNLRDGPSDSAPVIALIATNTTLKATARAGDWIKVIYQDRQGYLSAGIVNTDGVCQ